MTAGSGRQANGRLSANAVTYKMSWRLCSGILPSPYIGRRYYYETAGYGVSCTIGKAVHDDARQSNNNADAHAYGKGRAKVTMPLDDL